MTLQTQPRGRALSVREANDNTFNFNSSSSSSGSNSFVPNSREYWSSAASIVSSSMPRSSYPFLHVDLDLVSDLDLNSSASDLLRDCVRAFPPFAFIENSVLPIQTASAQGEMPLE